MQHQLALVAIGRELLIGHTADTNSAYLARAATPTGWRVTEIVAVDDESAKIIATLRRLSASNQIIIITGGIGPTPDDLTRQAIADFAGVDLIFHDELWTTIKARFAAFKREPTASNKLQAFLPHGARSIENLHGTAPGIDLTVGACRIFSLPGVPREMYSMFTAHILPILQASASPLYLKRWHLSGIGESVVGEIIREIAPSAPKAEIGTTVDNLIVTVRIMANAATAEIRNATAVLRARLAKFIVAEDDENLPLQIVRLLTQRQQTLAIAESCTGGLVAAEIVNIDGASKVLNEAIVCYSNAAKIRRCGVDEKILATDGAVSESCVIALAKNVRQNSGSDYGLSVSGIAGPGGGTAEKPVGLVWVAVADAHGVKAEKYHFIADRQGNRERAKNAALAQLWAAIKH